MCVQERAPLENIKNGAICTFGVHMLIFPLNNFQAYRSCLIS